MRSVKIIFVTAVVVAFSLPSFAGDRPVAPAARTGQTVSQATGDDGDLQKGAAWPSPRFTDNGDGTVTDRLTGLVWLEDANCFGTLSWENALAEANGLNAPECGLSDGSAGGDWRLANVNELESLLDYSRYDPALAIGHPFENVQSQLEQEYWSSTRQTNNSINAYEVEFREGEINSINISNVKYVWPVRGGL